jgi:chemotaxis protein histidine kinase CheA
MDQLRKQVARARRRLIIEQFLGRLIWSTLVALTLAAIAIAAPRIFVIPGLHENWDSIWLIGAFVGAFVFAIGWTFISNRSAIDAAIEIDRRFDLRERVASSLSLSPEDQTTEAGRAVVNDALRAVQRIEVDDKFRVNVGRRAWWPLVPAAAVFVLVAFFDNREASSTTDPSLTAQSAEQTKNALESLRKRIEEQRKQAKAQGLKEADDLLKQLEQGTRDLSQKDKVDAAKTHVKLNDLSRQLEERRKQLGGDEALKEQLQKMKDMGAGPADKAAQAMKQGDWNKALQEIDKLAKNIKDGKLSKEEKEQLANQLQKMKDKLEAAAEAHKQAMEDLKKQIDQQKKQGNLAKAGELQQKLDQMQKQQAQMDRMQKLAQQMAQAQQALQQGNNQKAADAMAQMAQQLDQMQKEMGEMKMLDAQLDQFQMAKEAMACKNCNGEGCEECQGNQFAMKGGMNPEGKPGRGMGEGVGIGDRPEERDRTNTRDTNVKQKQRRGAATVEGLAEGPNIRGDVAANIKEEMAASAAEPADPLTSDRLPQSRREQAEQYFEILREGK